MKTKIFLLMTSVSSLGSTTEIVKLNFEDLPKLVRERNQHTKGAKSFFTAAQEQTGFFARSYLPKVALEGGYETFKTGTYSQLSQPYGSVGVTANVFRGGNDKLEDQIREIQARLAQVDFQKAYLDELTETRKVFWTLMGQRELINILEDALFQNQKSLGAANKRIQAGLATETDRIEFEMAKVQLEQDLTRLRLGSSNSQRTLSVLLGMADDTSFATAETISHEHDDALFSASVDPEASRDVQALKFSSQIADNQHSQVGRWWSPSVDLYASYGLHTFRERDYPLEADRYETVFGVKLILVAFDGFESSRNASTLAMKARGYSDQASQTSREVKAHFEGLKQELKLTHDLIHSAEKSVEQGKKYLERTLSEYARGVKNSPDVLSSSEKYVDLRRRFTELRRDYQHAKTDLLSILNQ